jgi:hypothetical protein
MKQRKEFAELIETVGELGKPKTDTEAFGCRAVTKGECERFEDLTTEQAAKVIKSLKAAVERWRTEAAEDPYQAGPDERPVPDPETGEIPQDAPETTPTPEPVPAGAGDEGSFAF